MTSEWTSPEHAREYLQRADKIPHRSEGEATLLEELSPEARRVLDLGSGDGRLLELILRSCPSTEGVALDFSAPMLEELRRRFAEEDRVQIIEHNLEHPLPDLGRFDVVASSFAIHHLAHRRKRELYREVWQILEPGGMFANLEHVTSPTPSVHQRFLDAMEIKPEDEDSSNKLLDLETQLNWLREIGFQDVDCYWKWRELALMLGRKQAHSPDSG